MEQLPSAVQGTKPMLTPLLRQYIISIRKRDGVVTFPRMGLATRGQISNYLDAMKVWMRPPNNEEVAVRLAKLFAHSYAPNRDVEIAASVMEDWIRYMREVPAAVFADICEEWTREKGKRPTPADLLKMGRSKIQIHCHEYFTLKDALERAPELNGAVPTFDSDGNRLDEFPDSEMGSEATEEAIRALKMSKTGRQMAREGYLLDVVHFIGTKRRKPTKREAMKLKASVESMNARAGSGFDDAGDHFGPVLARVHAAWTERSNALNAEVLGSV